MNGGYYADLVDLTDRIRAEHRREVAKLEQKLADAAAYENDYRLRSSPCRSITSARATTQMPTSTTPKRSSRHRACIDMSSCRFSRRASEPCWAV
jgi:hypothetical protein